MFSRDRINRVLSSKVCFFGNYVPNIRVKKQTMSSWLSAVFAAVFGNIQLILPVTVSQARWYQTSFAGLLTQYTFCPLLAPYIQKISQNFHVCSHKQVVQNVIHCVMYQLSLQFYI